MERFDITANTLTEVVGTSTVDTLVAVTSGSGRICYGDPFGVSLSECIPVSAGYEKVVPAGVDVNIAREGGDLVVFVAPFGV